MLTLALIIKKNPAAMVVAGGARHFQSAQSHEQISNFQMGRQA
jgi:hypothetical protein